MSFLTVLPVPRRWLAEQFDLGRTVVWFPLVGAAVGAAAGGLRVTVAPLLGFTASTVLAIGALVLVTGALHLDGLADTADGVGVRGDRPRRLAVMSDSSVGAFGVLALVLWALLLLSVLAPLPGSRLVRALTTAGALSRAAAPAHALAAGSARPGGLGASLRPTPASTAIAAAISCGGALLLLGLGRGAVAIATGAACTAASSAWARRALGGSTGDTIGGTIVLSELAVCVVLLASWH